MKIKMRDKELIIGEKTLIMGILNMTPDSFSDGGDHCSVELAFQRAKKMIEEGVDIIDIGGQSTRPGHEEVTLEEELKRVVPIVDKIARELDIIISVDTYRYQVAAAVLKVGAHIINDVWGLQREEEMAKLIGTYGAGVIVMHNQNEKIYEEDIIFSIRKFLKKSIEIALNNGISRDKIFIDPGIGFGKNPKQNGETLYRMNELKDLGPIVLGTSRKNVVEDVLKLHPKDRLEISITTNVMGIERGAEIIRVHDIISLKRAAMIVDQIVRVKN